MSPLHSLAAASKAAAITFKSTWFSHRIERAHVSQKRVDDCKLPLDGRYFITTERGVFRIEKSGIYKVLDLPAYGISADKDYLYLALFLGSRSTLVRGRIGPFLGQDGAADLEEIYSVPLQSSNQRMHALWLGKTHLWVANTGRNSLIRLDRATLSERLEIPLFSDQFGYDLLHDVNHVNGVSEYDGTVFFSAYRAGEQSMLGYIDGHKITGFAYPNVGIHDIYLSSEGIFFCDTFGPAGSQSGGAVMTANGPFDPAYLSGEKGYVLRGLAGSPEEMLIGHSHKGKRRERFEGKGSLLLGINGRIQGEQPIAAAQVYQIMTCEGSFLSPPPEAMTAIKAHKLLATHLGDPIYEASIRPRELAPPSANS
ncbi:MAG: hypothetical protein RH942_12015 [Kiloniellaceae bacterium]